MSFANSGNLGRRALAWLIGAAAIAAFAPVASAATQDVDASKQYRTIGARRLYATYQRRIFKGKLPPLLYAIAITETEIDENGNVISALVTREPATAKEVRP